MLTQGESVEAHALRERGWSVSAIARHLGRDRKTVRAYLSGKREPGRRRPAAPDRFELYEAYCQVAGEPELGVGGDDEPGPAVGGGRVAQFRPGPAELLLQEPERALNVAAAQERLARPAHFFCGGGRAGEGYSEGGQQWNGQ